MSAAAPLPVLPFADPDTPRRDRLLWLAIVCGAAAVALAAAYIPSCRDYFGPYVESLGSDIVQVWVPTAQAGFVGAGFALSFAGRPRGASPRSRTKYLAAFSLAVIGLALLAFSQLQGGLITTNPWPVLKDSI